MILYPERTSTLQETVLASENNIWRTVRNRTRIIQHITNHGSEKEDLLMKKYEKYQDVLGSHKTLYSLYKK
jgi:hypothetical protein